MHDFIYSLFSSLFLPQQLLTFATLWHEVQGYIALSQTTVERNWFVINKNCKTNPTINPAFGHDLSLLDAAVKHSPELLLNVFNPGLKSPCAKVSCGKDSSQGWEMRKCCGCRASWNGDTQGNRGTWLFHRAKGSVQCPPKSAENISVTSFCQWCKAKPHSF